MIVDLRQIRSIQPTVHTEEAFKRVEGVEYLGSDLCHLEDDAVVNARSDGMALSRSGLELIFRGDAQGHLVQPWKSGALGQLYAVNFPCW